MSISLKNRFISSMLTISGVITTQVCFSSSIALAQPSPLITNHGNCSDSNHTMPFGIARTIWSKEVPNTYGYVYGDLLRYSQYRRDYVSVANDFDDQTGSYGRTVIDLKSPVFNGFYQFLSYHAVQNVLPETPKVSQFTCG